MILLNFVEDFILKKKQSMNYMKLFIHLIQSLIRYSLTWTFNYSENIYEDYRIKKHEISTIMNMLNDKESWQFKLLKEIAEKLIKNIDEELKVSVFMTSR